MKSYCCMFLYMFSLSACARSSVQGTWENQIFIIPASFDTVLINQNNRAQSFLANSDLLPRNVRTQYRSLLTLPGFQNIFYRMTMLQYMSFQFDYMLSIAKCDIIFCCCRSVYYKTLILSGWPQTSKTWKTWRNWEFENFPKSQGKLRENVKYVI